MGKKRTSDKQTRFVKAIAKSLAKKEFSIDEAARQLARDSAQWDLAELTAELATAVTVTAGGS